MSDPMSWVGGGLAAGGVGGMISAFNTPDGPQTIHPEVQAFLQQQGIDINRYMAELQGGQTDFSQKMAQLSPEQEKAIQAAYEQNYGPMEKEAIGNALAALRGEQTPVTKNLLAQYGSQFGGQRSATDEQVNQMIAQSGMDPSSPYAQALRAKAQGDITGQYAQGAGNIMSQQAISALNNAYNTLQTGMTTDRMTGYQPPETPLTARQEIEKARQDQLAQFQGGKTPMGLGGLASKATLSGSAFGANPYAVSGSKASYYMPQYLSPNNPSPPMMQTPMGSPQSNPTAWQRYAKNQQQQRTPNALRGGRAMYAV